MATEDVNRLIDMLCERIEEAKAPAMRPHLAIIDRDEFLDIMEEIKTQLPMELNRAKELLKARERFVDEAKREAERRLRDADQEVRNKVSDSEVLYTAREQARQTIARAEERSRQLYQVANEYAEDALSRMEAAAQAALDEVKQARAQFRTASNMKMQEQREKLNAEEKETKE